MRKFYKILNKQNTHYGMTYVPNSWNTDILPYDPKGTCRAGGLYFADLKHIFEFIIIDDFMGGGICEVINYMDDKGNNVYHDEGHKQKAYQLLLGERRLITKELIIELIKAGADIHAGDEAVLRIANELNDLDFIKELINLGADHHAFDDNPFRMACDYGRLELVKFYLELGGVDVFSRSRYAFRSAMDKRNNELLELLNEYVRKQNSIKNLDK